MKVETDDPVQWADYNWAESAKYYGRHPPSEGWSLQHRRRRCQDALHHDLYDRNSFGQPPREEQWLKDVNERFQYWYDLMHSQKGCIL